MSAARVAPLAATFDSVLESVDAAELVVREYAGRVGFAEPDQYFIGLAFREIFINALKHGNGFDASKRIHVRLAAVAGGGIEIEVRDEGAGFVLEDVPDPCADENLDRRSGRGLAMARGLMDEFLVETAPGNGTRVRMSKRHPVAPIETDR